MDYEKKYKEALELARVAALNGHQSLMEGIFPELKESDDEKTRKRIIALVNAHGQGMYKDDMLAWLENIPYTIDHEKREGFHLGYKAALEKQGEQKPWSEEDEEHYKACLQYFDAVNPDMVYYKDYQWLKSLRPQNTWKPSDAQMKALDSVIDEYDGYPEFDSLVSLKNDLRKL